MTCLLLHCRILQQSGILARCILFCFVAFHRIYMYVCFSLLPLVWWIKIYIIWLGNNQENFLLHRFTASEYCISQNVLGSYTFLVHPLNIRFTGTEHAARICCLSLHRRLYTAAVLVCYWREKIDNLNAVLQRNGNGLPMHSSLFP